MLNRTTFTAIQARNPVLSGVSFVNLDGHTHFRLANVKLGYVDDTLPPVITVGATRFNATNQQLTLQFSTDELTTCAVEYGMANWASVVWAPRDWSGDPTYSTLRMAYTNHTVILSNLIAGATYQYKIVARDHRTDPALEPNQAIYTNFFTIPGPPPTRRRCRRR